MPLPDEVNILGKHYPIVYVDKPSEVDAQGRTSLWGQIDYWTRTIRIYDNKMTAEDIWQTLLHEVLHAIVQELNITKLDSDEDTINLLALALADVFIRNDWLKRGENND